MPYLSRPFSSFAQRLTPIPETRPPLLRVGPVLPSLLAYQRQRRHRNIHTDLVFVVGLVVAVVVI